MVSDKILQEVANVLRRDVLKMTTLAGSGHPTSCFSCAEIMSVLFFHEMKYDTGNPFNPNSDEFILSKGHAAPILYSALYHAGCIKTNLFSLRTLKSPLEGHPVPSSLKWVKVATGSLGQGLGAGLGFALAAKLQNRNFKTFVLLGDSEVMEGSVFEALELAAHYKLNNLIAIVDINRLGQRGETILGHKIPEYKKRFSGFGWKTLVINGHNIKEIKSAFSKIDSKKPLMILAKTFKGKGVDFLQDKEEWHGKALNNEELERALSQIPDPKIPKIRIEKPKKINYKVRTKKAKKNLYNLFDDIATRDSYGKALASLAEANPLVLAIDAEVSNSTRANLVKKTRPKQFIEAFIAEQNMISTALGLSKKGFNVFASTFSAFLSRAHDQLRMAAVSSGNFTVSGSHAGVSVGSDGVSQMGLEDIAIFRDLPESFVFYPSDAVSTEKIMHHCSQIKKGIRYIRTTREKTPVLYKNSEKFKIGDFKILKSSKKDKAVLVGSGITTHEALKAYNELQNQNIDVSVIDLYCIKPFNAKKFIKFVKKHGNKVIVSEDHYSEGGIGEMLAENLENTGIKIKHLAIRELPHSGKPEELLEKYKINSSAMVKEVKSLR